MFVWTIVIVLRSTKSRLERTKEKLKAKTVFRVITSLVGVMILFGLTWLFAAFTVTIDNNEIVRTVFQVLFVICASFQGFFIFLFFCILDQKARNAWKGIFLPSDAYDAHSWNSFRLNFTRSKRGTGSNVSSNSKLPDSQDSKCKNYTVTQI